MASKHQTENAGRQSTDSCSESRENSYRHLTPGILSAHQNLFGSAQLKTAEACLLGTELSFYQNFSWCLNPFPTVGETVGHLDEELARLGTSREAWHVGEVMTNVFLLSCTLLNSIDDYLHGPTYRVPKRASRLPFARLAQGALKVAETSTAILRWFRVARATRWKQQWQIGFDAFLELFVCGEPPRSEALAHAARQLSLLLRQPLPADLQVEHIRIPSAFRKQDLTHFDVLALAGKFVAEFRDRRQPVLIVGLRTAGAYFAPLFRAFLKSKGYQVVDMVTIRPNRDLAPWEHNALARCGRGQYMAVLVDEPPFTGGTISLGVEQLRKAGFHSDKLVVLFPIRPVGRGWRTHVESTGFRDEFVLCLQPEEWHKQRLLAPEVVEGRLREYFLHGRCVDAAVIASPTADELNAQLMDASAGNERERLKRIYAVRLETQDGRSEIRYVLAKSVGWGLFGYSAFLAGCQLAGFVPPLLGLREGILYMEWIPQTKTSDTSPLERSQWIERAARYVAARVVSLGLTSDPTPRLGLDPQHEGFRVFENSLCKAYGTTVAAKLMKGRVRRRLSRRTCPFPTLIDGKMSPSEWITSASGPLKTDFEHHGFGKQELNVTDPAYDLADAVLQFRLSSAEERELIRCYVDTTGDTRVRDRLFFNKLIAGCWSMAASLDGLVKSAQTRDRAAEFNEQYVRAWDFLTRESARFCGALCHRPQSPCWSSPVVVLDVDGVLDRRIFGFPTTTAAGIRALRWLHAHGLAAAINTARSAGEVKEYCRAYGFVGGVAEYGSYVFDAVANRGNRLVSAAALAQLDQLRQALQQLPGVFLNDGYEYSIRAYTYERHGMVPLPSAMVPNLMSRLNLDRLHWLQTSIDTTIVAKDVDKGRGLRGLLTWAGHPNLETVAIGDSEPDLAMFRTATRSFAPGKIGRPDLVRAAGGRIARDPYQRGLLGIVRSLIHPDGSGCRSCPPSELEHGAYDDLFLDLLEAADEKRSALLLRALLHPKAFQVFVRT